MNDPISNEAAYYISELNTQQPFYNPIAQGISIIETPGEEYWGIVSWFDKIAAYLRTVEIQTAPVITGESYEIVDTDGRIVKFNYIDKDVYNDKIKSILPMAPDLIDSNDIQKYINELNPYI